jgi:dTDP-glucose pyrophosphorylase
MLVNPGQIEPLKYARNGPEGKIFTDKTQAKPRGLPEALKQGKPPRKKQAAAQTTGDKTSHGQSPTKTGERTTKHKSGANKPQKEADKPEKQGDAKTKKNKRERTAEKPKKRATKKARTGTHQADKKAGQNASKRKPAKRGEQERADPKNKHKKTNKQKDEPTGRGADRADAGKTEDHRKGPNYVRSVEKVQGIKIACLDEIAFLKGWISKKIIKENIKFYGNCEYSAYLKKIIV